MSIRVGTDGLIELLPAAWTYSPATGQLALRRWKGPHATAEAYAESLINTGLEVSLEPTEGTPLSIVSVRDVSGSESGGDVDANVATIWTLTPQLKQADVMIHPRIVAIVRGFNDTQAAQFLGDVKEVQDGVATPSTFARYNTAAWRPIYEGLRLVANNVKDFHYCVATLRKSRVVSPNSAITADWVGVNKIYSTARLRQLEDIPTGIIGALENGDWYKVPGMVEQMGDGRYSISTEWLFDYTGNYDTSLLYVRG